MKNIGNNLNSYRPVDLISQSKDKDNVSNEIKPSPLKYITQQNLITKIFNFLSSLNPINLFRSNPIISEQKAIIDVGSYSQMINEIIQKGTITDNRPNNTSNTDEQLFFNVDPYITTSEQLTKSTVLPSKNEEFKAEGKQLSPLIKEKHQAERLHTQITQVDGSYAEVCQQMRKNSHMWPDGVYQTNDYYPCYFQVYNDEDTCHFLRLERGVKINYQNLTEPGDRSLAGQVFIDNKGNLCQKQLERLQYLDNNANRESMEQLQDIMICEKFKDKFPGVTSISLSEIRELPHGNKYQTPPLDNTKDVTFNRYFSNHDEIQSMVDKNTQLYGDNYKRLTTLAAGNSVTLKLRVLTGDVFAGVGEATTLTIKKLSQNQLPFSNRLFYACMPGKSDEYLYEVTYTSKTESSTYLVNNLDLYLNCMAYFSGATALEREPLNESALDLEVDSNEKSDFDNITEYHSLHDVSVGTESGEHMISADAKKRLDIWENLGKDSDLHHYF